MATRMKRCSYVSDTESSSTEDGHTNIPKGYNKYDQSDEINSYRYGKAKCSSRNAVMARENRIKKKRYMQNLEQEVKILRKDNSKLNVIVENQSSKIAELHKRVQYMKSALANSSDLRILMQNIQCSTGMSVATSLDKNLTLINNDCISYKHEPQGKTATHPWNDDKFCTALKASTDLQGEIEQNFDSLSELNIFNGEPFPSLFDIETLDDNSESNSRDLKSAGTYNEHNYTRTPNDRSSAVITNEVGVCLHVSKHRVSLEFCSSCSENAIETWKAAE